MKVGKCGGISRPSFPKQASPVGVLANGLVGSVGARPRDGHLSTGRCPRKSSRNRSVEDSFGQGRDSRGDEYRQHGSGSVPKPRRPVDTTAVTSQAASGVAR